MLWPIARDAVELLFADDVRHVRECAGDRCAWLFMDASRTRRRRNLSSVVGGQALPSSGLTVRAPPRYKAAT